MESHSQIEDGVAEWLARKDSGNWSQDDEARLQQWLGASTARRVAYLRLKSTWDAAGRLRALRAGPMGSASANPDLPAFGEWRRSPFFEQSAAPRTNALIESDLSHVSGNTSAPDIDGSMANASIAGRRQRTASAIAAGVVLAIAVGFGAYHFWAGSGDRYATAVGGTASVPMIDGSKVTLNTDSVILVALTEKERRVQLEHGEAFFDVAKDPHRAFVVRAGDRRITAVGTKFLVQHLGEEVRVLVTEGRVRVESSGGHASANTDTGEVLLTAGDIVRAKDAAMIVRKAEAPQVEEILAWREGHLRFHETALVDAVAEMNRYNTRKISIEDPRLAAVKISGTFRPTEYEAFVRVLQNGFSIQAQAEGERIILTQVP